MTKDERRRELERIYGNTLEGERKLYDLYLEAVGPAREPEISWLKQIEAILNNEFPAF